jgi:hypothetical protein
VHDPVQSFEDCAFCSVPVPQCLMLRGQDDLVVEPTGLRLGQRDEVSSVFGGEVQIFTRILIVADPAGSGCNRFCRRSRRSSPRPYPSAAEATNSSS